ncbi:hypothetical protein PLESTF_000599500 [Pleodorina starrii]|nr:hypothetical protein PLESTF_000599500 [Pleodorina starrii]
MYEGAPWSVRLACKLLRHLAAGDGSPWAPYIKVLPRHVPAPLESFSWEDISGLRYPAAQEALHSAGWLAADSFAAASEEARGGPQVGEEEFRWALSVAHSRTFANAAPGGGVGVRMLVPLVDMLNHGGDEAAEGGVGLGLGSGRPVATDCVRWDLLSPARSRTGGWSMAVSATRDIAPGQELLMSYGERPNDDFFLHYGFVPRANPHDDAVLWPDLESALEWHYERLGAAQLSREEAEPMYLAALEAGRLEQSAELQQAQAQTTQQQQQQQGGGGGGGGGGGREGGSVPAAEAQEGLQLPPEVARQMAQIKVVAGGQVSAAVMRAFAAVSGGDVAMAERAVALRCAELLWDMTAPAAAAAAEAAGDQPVTPGLCDGSSNTGDDSAAAASASVGAVGLDVAAASVRSDGGSGGGGGLLAELARLLLDADPRVAAAAVAAPAAAAAAVEPEGGDARYWAEQLRGYCQVLLPRFAELLPEGPAATAALAAAAAAAAAAATDTAAPAGGRPGATGGGIKSRYGRPPPALASPSLPPPRAAAAPPQAQAETGTADSGAVPLGQLVRAMLPGAATAAAAAATREMAGPAADGLRLTGPQRLSATFRVYKQMVLWDVLLGSAVAPGELIAFARGGGRQ